jgi:hypothetical protein
MYNVEGDDVVFEPKDDDGLMDELLASNPTFQALVAKSKAGLRKSFSAGDPMRSAWRKLDRDCPTCGNAALEETRLSWSGRTPEGCRTGGMSFPVRCANCGARFFRYDHALLAPEDHAEREREREERQIQWWKTHRSDSSPRD